MDSPGRSGAKFFISFDKRFVIKSITGEEVALLHLILQPYHAVSAMYVYCRLHHKVQVSEIYTPRARGPKREETEWSDVTDLYHGLCIRDSNNAFTA